MVIFWDADGKGSFIVSRDQESSDYFMYPDMRHVLVDACMQVQRAIPRYEINGAFSALTTTDHT